jgi:hypothetical protein
MTFRRLVLVGVKAGLLLAGFNHNALASTFTNGDFTTFIQEEWGGDPDTSAAAALLQANYDSVYASTTGAFEVGLSGAAGFSMVFTAAPELSLYLPAVGPIGPLTSDLVNPTSSASGGFGGEVTALNLNINFSDAGLLAGNLGIPFGDLVLQNFSIKSNLRGLNGLTVRQFSVIVSTLLGGSSYGSYTIAELDTIVVEVNSSFADGNFNGFATTNLTLPSNTLMIQTVGRAGSALTFTWNTIPNQRYQVQSSTSLSQTNWTSLGGILTATNTTTSATEVSTNAQMFYRIQLLP